MQKLRLLRAENRNSMNGNSIIGKMSSKGKIQDKTVYNEKN